MPPAALSLALAASIYPPAVAAVIALGRGTDVRLRVVLFVAGAFVTVLLTGALILLLLDELPVSGRQHRTAGGGLEVAIGLLLLGLAARLRRRAGKGNPAEERGSARTDRYLESRRLVLLLGFVLYVIPSPIYIGAIKSIADTSDSVSTEFAYLAVVVVVMLWMVELPMIMLLVVPGRATATLERVNAWFAGNGRALAVLASAGAGLYLVLSGLMKLIE